MLDRDSSPYPNRARTLCTLISSRVLSYCHIEWSFIASNANIMQISRSYFHMDTNSSHYIPTSCIDLLYLSYNVVIDHNNTLHRMLIVLHMQFSFFLIGITHVIITLSHHAPRSFITWPHHTKYVSWCMGIIFYTITLLFYF